jgi:hypothetical protein
MKNTKWYPVYYNGLETNVEVTKCGRVKRIKKDWYGNGSGSYQIKYEEIDFSKLKAHHQGYYRIKIQIKEIDRKTVYVHQLVASAFLDYKFQGHKLVVDHIDSNKQNNHVNNLRVITNRENVSKEKAIKSGLPAGVFFNKTAKKYQSNITINSKQIYLGIFNTINEASQAYQNKLKTIL